MAKKNAPTRDAASIADVRNIGIIAHIDAGKTTTTERILFYTGESHRMGEVDEGTTTTDFDAEEADRGITIYSAAVTCHWTGPDGRKQTINLIDTPGHVDFTAEVERSLRVLDGAVTIFSAVEGVEAQSETVWRQADRYGVPRLCFINKMDRIGASFGRTLEQIETRLGATPLPVTIPVGEGPTFEAIIDLLDMKLLRFDAASKGMDYERLDIPQEHAEYADEWRGKLLEAVAMLDDDVMEQYLETGEVGRAEVDRLLREATLAGDVQPLYCGSSLDFCGVQPVLDAVAAYLPSPLDRPPVSGINPRPGKKDDPDAELTRGPSPEEPMTALVFKIVADAHADLAFARVYSGVLKAGTRPMNARTGKKELAGQLWRIQADRREQVEEALPGDIIGLVGLKETVTGDTLCEAQQPIALESITFPETVISMAVEPESSADRKKLEETLSKLSRQDPTFRAQVSEETGQTIISGMGELHLEVLRNKMLRDFKLNVRVHKPRVSYRETIRKAAEETGTFERAGEKPAFGEVTVRVEPRPAKADGSEHEEPVTLANKVKPGDLPPDLRHAVDESIRESAHSGGVLGYPLMNVTITVVGAKTREGESTEDAMRAAAAMAFQEALQNGDVLLLEPIMKLEVVSPDESVGAVQADLNQRHAAIVGAEPRGDMQVIQAEAPLASMFGYSTQVRSLSQGRASYSMEPLKYDFAPESVLKDMLGV